MTQEEAINILIKSPYIDGNKISDGYHTFGELYEHRITLYITLCRILDHNSIMKYNKPLCWKSLKDSNGIECKGWFLLGIAKGNTHQITYHLPIDKWEECNSIETLNQAPLFDGHTSTDVLNRIKQLFI